VVIVGLGGDAALAERALGLGAPVAAAVEARGAALGDFVDRLRLAGGEALALDAAPEGAFIGVALRGGSVPPAAAAAGMLALDLRGAAAALDYDAAPTLRPDLAAPAGSGADRVFQTLREAARRGRADGRVAIVALPAEDAALKGLARWLAVTDVAAVPLTVAVR
jgi:hypothetical protein